MAICCLLFSLDLNFESSVHVYINILIRYLISSLVFHHLIWDEKWCGRWPIVVRMKVLEGKGSKFQVYVVDLESQ